MLVRKSYEFQFLLLTCFYSRIGSLIICNEVFMRSLTNEKSTFVHLVQEKQYISHKKTGLCRGHAEPFAPQIHLLICTTFAQKEIHLRNIESREANGVCIKLIHIIDLNSTN